MTAQSCASVALRRRVMRQDLAHDARQRFAGDVGARDPAHSGGRGGARANARRIDHELEREMREGVASPRRAAAARQSFLARGESLGAASSADRSSKSCVHAVVGTSVMPPSKPFGGRVRRSTAPSARVTTKAAPRRSRPSALRALRGNALGIAARARAHKRRSKGRARRPASSACRWWRRDPSALARNRRSGRRGRSVSARRLISRLRRRQFAPRSRTGASPRARHCRRSRPRVDRMRSPRSPPPCRARCREACAIRPRSRKAAAVPLDHGFRAGVQIARARVVAEPGPGFEHVFERRARKTSHVRPAREKARVIRRDRLHRGLLQHDLGEPDAIGIGPLAGRRAPRQMPAMAVVPGEQCGRIRRSAIGSMIGCFRAAAPASLMPPM